MWEAENCGGYLRIKRDGRRVADAFPYAKDGIDQDFVREQVDYIVNTLNAIESPAYRDE